MSMFVRRTAPVLGAIVATLALSAGTGAHEIAPILAPVLVAPPQASTPPPPPPASARQAGTQPPPPPVDSPSADQETRTLPPPPPAAPPPATTRAPGRPPQPRPAIAPDTSRAEGSPYVSKGVNIRVDAMVTESRGDQVLGKKVVTVTVLDGWNGQVRSTQQVPFRTKGNSGFNYQNAPFNMDAQARLRDDGRVLVSLTLDYRGGPPQAEAESETLDQGIRQSVTVVLESGKPLIVAQSADAVGDRRVTLELEATVLK